MCMRMRICMCMCMCACVCVHVYVTCACVCVCACLCMHVYVYVCVIYIFISSYTCMPMLATKAEWMLLIPTHRGSTTAQCRSKCSKRLGVCNDRVYTRGVSASTRSQKTGLLANKLFGHTYMRTLYTHRLCIQTHTHHAQHGPQMPIDKMK